MEKKKSEKIKLTALWSKTLSNGTTIMTGKLGDAQIEIWPNQFKKKENQPDYNVFISPPFKKEGGEVPQDFGQPDFSNDFGNDIPF